MTAISDLPDQLTARLRQPLPGPPAQRRYAPQICYGRHFGPPRYDARRAAVIALLCPTASGWAIPLTLRPAHMADHAGQISLPGGAVEAGESAESCALRELEEELAVPSRNVQVLGGLSPIYVFASNFIVTPIVGAADAMPQLNPNPQEVAEVLTVPIDELLAQRNYGVHTIERRGLRFRAPHIEFAGQRIWGATCLILGELIALLRENTAER